MAGTAFVSSTDANQRTTNRGGEGKGREGRGGEGKGGGGKGGRGGKGKEGRGEESEEEMYLLSKWDTGRYVRSDNWRSNIGHLLRFLHKFVRP